MEKIKVLQVNKLYYPAVGGIEKTVQYITEGLKEDMHIKVLTCQSKGRGIKEVVNGVEVFRCGSIGTFLSLPLSFSFLQEFRKQAKEADIVQFHIPFPLGDLACMLSGYKGKVAVYWHSDIVKQKKLIYFYYPFMKWFLQRADVIIVGADGIANSSPWLKPYRNKCITIPFAVDEETERSGGEYLKRNSPNLKRQARFLFVGRLVYYKGIDVLLKAFQNVKNAELVIVGKGDLENEIKHFIHNLRLSQKVSLLGEIGKAELYHEYELCDILVLPSTEKSEAFGLVQLEAMAYGKPVINTRLKSGVPEVSIDGLTGLTVTPGDDEELSDAMQWMVDHPTERNRMGMEARKRLEKNFSMKSMLEKVGSLYRELKYDKIR